MQANIHSIMGSEDQVMELMVLLDTGLQQVDKIEEKLNEYEHKLQVCVLNNVCYVVPISLPCVICEHINISLMSDQRCSREPLSSVCF